jgi:hypothetical protein
MNDGGNSTVMESTSTKAHAAQPSYELHSLGWKAFQQLCVAVASEIWGQTVQGFYDSHDGGRDGAFHGQWKAISGEALSGTFTVQCKFTSRPAKVLRLADLKDEISKIERLAGRGLADNYFLFTNARLTGDFEEKLRSTVLAISGLKHFAAYGSDRISQFIHESPRLRMLVPRIYGLGDLSQILDGRAYAQSQEILSALGDIQHGMAERNVNVPKDKRIEFRVGKFPLQVGNCERSRSCCSTVATQDWRSWRAAMGRYTTTLARPTSNPRDMRRVRQTRLGQLPSRTSANFARVSTNSFSSRKFTSRQR